MEYKGTIMPWILPYSHMEVLCSLRIRCAMTNLVGGHFLGVNSEFVTFTLKFQIEEMPSFMAGRVSIFSI